MRGGWWSNGLVAQGTAGGAAKRGPNQGGRMGGGPGADPQQQRMGVGPGNNGGVSPPQQMRSGGSVASRGSRQSHHNPQQRGPRPHRQQQYPPQQQHQQQQRGPPQPQSSKPNSNVYTNMEWTDLNGKVGYYTGEIDESGEPHGLGGMRYLDSTSVEGEWYHGELVATRIRSSGGGDDSRSVASNARSSKGRRRNHELGPVPAGH